MQGIYLIIILLSGKQIPVEYSDYTLLPRSIFFNNVTVSSSAFTIGL